MFSKVSVLLGKSLGTFNQKSRYFGAKPQVVILEAQKKRSESSNGYFGSSSLWDFALFEIAAKSSFPGIFNDHTLEEIKSILLEVGF